MLIFFYMNLWLWCRTKKKENALLPHTTRILLICIEIAVPPFFKRYSSPSNQPAFTNSLSNESINIEQIIDGLWVYCRVHNEFISFQQIESISLSHYAFKFISTSRPSRCRLQSSDWPEKCHVKNWRKKKIWGFFLFDEKCTAWTLRPVYRVYTLHIDKV